MSDSTTFEDAIERTKRTGAWLLAHATSRSSKECAMMDSTTLSNPEIVAWIKANALVVFTFAVDEENKLAQDLKIRVLPTLIAFRNGREVERLRGFRSWPDLLFWFHGFQSEITIIGDPPRIAQNGSVRARRDGAAALLRSGRYAEATNHYAWLWKNIPRVAPEMEGVRRSFLALEIDSLVRAWPQAAERFADLRDNAALDATSDPRTVDAWMDWVVLNSALGDDERTLSWFDTVKRDPSAWAITFAVSRYLRRPLRLRNRWADLGRLYGDPLKELAFLYEVSTIGSVFGPARTGKNLSSKVTDVATVGFRTEAADSIQLASEPPAE